MAAEPLLRARGVVKGFGATQALDGLDFDLAEGEIHALVGRNGAGKSTFIKILAGLEELDAGEIAVAGAPLAPAGGPLAFIHQDLALVPSLSVADNIGLVAGFAGRRGVVDDRRHERAATASLHALGVELDPRRPVAELSLSERALVAVARALHLDAPAVILDEPTASLPAADVERLFAALRRLRDRGVGILYVSHRLAEVRALADRVTVLRNGRAEATVRPGEVSEPQLAQLIMGEELLAAERRPHPVARDVVLRVDGLVAEGLEPLTLDVRAGEVVGCAGLRGAGQETLGRALYGLVPWSGEARIDGAPYRGASPADALRAGVAYVTGDRSKAIAGSLTLAENLFLGQAGGRRVVPRRERATAAGVIDRYGVVAPGPDALIEVLSGGNAQKIVLARALESAPRVLLLEEPTAGVDVGACAEFHRLVDDACRQGLAVVLASSDAEEVCEMADRVLVFERGAVREELTGSQVTADRVAGSAMGARAAA